MPITNLGRTSSGSILIDRSVEAAEWRHIPTYTSAEGGPAQSISVKDFLDGDVTTVATQGNFESAVFATSGTNLDLTITGTPRAAVMDGEQLADTITLRAQGASVGGVAPSPVDQTWTVVTFSQPTEKVFWRGLSQISVNEGTTAIIGLSQFVYGLPDNSFDSVAFVTDPSQNWITLENAATTMATLKIVAPLVNATQQISVTLRVTKSTATPKTDDTTVRITVLDLNPSGATGLNIVRWDFPDQIITAGTFMAAVFFDAELGESDTLVPADIYIDGVTGVVITSIAKDSNDPKKYNLTCTAADNTYGVATFGLVRT